MNKGQTALEMIIAVGGALILGIVVLAFLLSLLESGGDNTTGGATDLFNFFENQERNIVKNPGFEAGAINWHEEPITGYSRATYLVDSATADPGYPKSVEGNKYLKITATQSNTVSTFRQQIGTPDDKIITGGRYKGSGYIYIENFVAGTPSPAYPPSVFIDLEIPFYEDVAYGYGVKPRCESNQLVEGDAGKWIQVRFDCTIKGADPAYNKCVGQPPDEPNHCPSVRVVLNNAGPGTTIFMDDFRLVKAG